MVNLKRLRNLAIIPVAFVSVSCAVGGGPTRENEFIAVAPRFEMTHRPIVTSPVRAMTAAGEVPGGESSAVCLRLTRARNEDRQHEAPLVVGTKRGFRSADPYVLKISPRLLVVGQRNVSIRVRLERFGRDYRFRGHGENAFYLCSQDSGWELPLSRTTHELRTLEGVVDEVTADMVGWHEMVVVLNGRTSEPVPFAVRVVEQVRIALTFDDGPSVERFRYLGTNQGGESRTSSEKILDVLKAEGIVGAFFVLTAPDTFLWKRHPKAETQDGFTLLRRMVRDGHVVAAHWGGSYIHQTVCHPARMAMPAYDYDGDGTLDRVTPAGNALETDLLQCVGRIAEAYAAEGSDEHACEFVRPPLWRYKSGEADTRPLYRRMGLKMIFTDGKLSDGGYPLAGGTFNTWLARGISGSLDRGHADVILTMHDSNPHTARDFEIVLHDIRAFMTGRGLVEGMHWKFVDSSDEMTELFRGKTHYRKLAAG
jgi:peptidoglycan/xylan/chitin deacetylase (PgdA/CDA1 family)